MEKEKGHPPEPSLSPGGGRDFRLKAETAVAHYRKRGKLVAAAAAQ
jgi:hypothetical protein